MIIDNLNDNKYWYDDANKMDIEWKTKIFCYEVTVQKFSASLPTRVIFIHISP